MILSKEENERTREENENARNLLQTRTKTSHTTITSST